MTDLPLVERAWLKYQQHHAVQDSQALRLLLTGHGKWVTTTNHPLQRPSDATLLNWFEAHQRRNAKQ